MKTFKNKIKMSENESQFLKQFRISAAIATASLLMLVGSSIINTHFKTSQLEKDMACKADKVVVELNNSFIAKELKEIKDDLRLIQEDLKAK